MICSVIFMKVQILRRTPPDTVTDLFIIGRFGESAPRPGRGEGEGRGNNLIRMISQWEANARWVSQTRPTWCSHLVSRFEHPAPRHSIIMTCSLFQRAPGASPPKPFISCRSQVVRTAATADSSRPARATPTGSFPGTDRGVRGRPRPEGSEPLPPGRPGVRRNPHVVYVVLTENEERFDLGGLRRPGFFLSIITEQGTYTGTTLIER